ncbi:MAG: 3'-5' exoribonuclease [Candidatus Omnitrophica bacterium]|nr:3'-5' exoribonuclease [Candidatus Omnitrophota bacterium]MCB9719266.1 3'-5' exoribonuclease [Candidatus Omnitrophota bacterium]
MILKEMPMVIVDIETTGGRYYNHRIIEIGMIKVADGRQVDEYQALINPECLIPGPITTLTGITNDMVRDAPVFRDVHEEIYRFLEGSIFVAHNARFDYGFVKKEFERLDVRFTAKVLCSVRLSRRLFSRFKRHNLSTLMERYDIKIANRHRALDDARAVWEFFKVICDTVPEERQARAIKDIIRKPSIPPKLTTDIEGVPESPGVYFFMNEEEMPLYIGKAKNLRSRILSHFTENLHSSKEVNISQNVVRIDTVLTEGELAALLLESYFIKSQAPLYNRRSRRHWRLTALRVDTSGEYHTVQLDDYKVLGREDMPGVVAVFRTKRDAQRFLEGIAKEYQLCKTLLGLDKNRNRTGCFYHQIKQCHGACIGQEPAVKYNLRLHEAMAKHRRLSWPFDGPVMITEQNVEGTCGEVIVVDHWIIREAFRFRGEEKTPLFDCDNWFDLDAFRILYGHIKRQKNLNLKVIREEQIPVTPESAGPA